MQIAELEAVPGGPPEPPNSHARWPALAAPAAASRAGLINARMSTARRSELRAAPPSTITTQTSRMPSAAAPAELLGDGAAASLSPEVLRLSETLAPPRARPDLRPPPVESVTSITLIQVGAARTLQSCCVAPEHRSCSGTHSVRCTLRFASSPINQRRLLRAALACAHRRQIASDQDRASGYVRGLVNQEQELASRHAMRRVCAGNGSADAGADVDDVRMPVHMVNRLLRAYADSRPRPWSDRQLV